MAKFYGTVGYSKTKKTKPGVYEEVITERIYYGDIINYKVYHQSIDKVNDDLKIEHIIEVIADDYMFDNYANIKYVIFDGFKWTVSSIQNKRPRIRLYLGGLYNV